MKFTCEKYLLSLAVATAGRAAAAKSPIPALEGLLIEASHSVRITGFDLKKGIYTSFEADVVTPGSIVVPSKLFGEIVRKLPDGIASFEVNGSAARITCGNADYSIMCSSSDDYPELPSLDHCRSVVINQGSFARMVAESSFAISDNESRPVYTGAQLIAEDGKLTMVAVDGYRLALRREKVEECEEGITFIVPGDALRDMEKLCISPEENVKISVGSKHISFAVGDTVLISRRLEGDFLNYKKTVPTVFPITVTANRADMIRCAERVSLIIDDRSKHPLRCTFKEGEMNVSCSTPLGTAEDSCAIDGNGGDTLIGFNNAYLLDALKAAPAEKLKVNLAGSSSPCVLTDEEGNDNFLYMILPVRLRSE